MAPKPGEKDPEGSVEWREPGPRMAVNVDGQLLAKCQLHDGLVLASPEERNRATHHRSDESEQRPEHHSILLVAGVEWEPESRATVDLSFRDAEDGHAETRAKSLWTNNGHAQE